MPQLLTNQQSRLLGTHTNAAADWWLANSTIALANVAEHVETPTAGQDYAGGTLAGAWTVSFRCNLVSVPTTDQYAFSAQSGAFTVGTGSGINGFFTASWNNPPLFATGDHTYMLVSSGTSIQAYRDGSAVGSPTTSGNDIGGAVKWRTFYSVGYTWAAAVRAGHVANVALDSTQRAALHTSMMALS